MFRDWIIDNSVLILTIVSLFMTLFSLMYNKYRALNWLLSWLIIFIATFTTFGINGGTAVVPALAIIAFVTTSLSDKVSRKFLKIYSIIQYIIVMLLLLLAIKFAGVSPNTWGNSTIYYGVFMIVFLVPTKHLARRAYKRKSMYGLIELLTGLIAMSIILIVGFEKENEYLANKSVREGLVVLVCGLIIEGVLLLKFREIEITTKTE